MSVCVSTQHCVCVSGSADICAAGGSASVRAGVHVHMSGTGSEGPVWVSVCLCGCDRGVCALGSDGSSGSSTVTPCPIRAVGEEAGGPGSDSQRRFQNVREGGIPAASQSPRQIRWVGRKPEPSEPSLHSFSTVNPALWNGAGCMSSCWVWGKVEEGARVLEDCPEGPSPALREP